MFFWDINFINMASLVVVLFIAGYVLLTLEHTFKINKAATALLTGTLCWVFYLLGEADPHHVLHELFHHVSEISGIVFFLLGAMTVVEIIDAHHGFDLITSRIRTRSKRKLLWIVCGLTFGLSAVLDNLTTTIVCVSLVKKLIEDRNERMWIVGMVVIAANAGGAWSPIGDVSTTMLWIAGRISATEVITQLFIPSLLCLLVPMLVVHYKFKGQLSPFSFQNNHGPIEPNRFEKHLVFWLGLALLIFVPIFKSITHLPPYFGMLLALAVLWFVTEVIHRKKDEDGRTYLSVSKALTKIDTPSILFFMGILLSVTALQSMGQLAQLSAFLNQVMPDERLVVFFLGLLSAIVDNVPLVSAAIGMYDTTMFPADSSFWQFVAYATGTGGSALIIGSAAGVAAMGMEKIDFLWYLKRISWLALLGYLSGALVYLGVYYK